MGSSQSSQREAYCAGFVHRRREPDGTSAQFYKEVLEDTTAGFEFGTKSQKSMENQEDVA